MITLDTWIVFVFAGSDLFGTGFFFISNGSRGRQRGVLWRIFNFGFFDLAAHSSSTTMGTTRTSFFLFPYTHSSYRLRETQNSLVYAIELGFIIYFVWKGMLVGIAFALLALLGFHTCHLVSCRSGSCFRFGVIFSNR